MKSKLTEDLYCKCWGCKGTKQLRYTIGHYEKGSKCPLCDDGYYFLAKMQDVHKELAEAKKQIDLCLIEGDKSFKREIKKEFTGKTLVECAEIILTEHGNEPIHYRDIAKEAHHRGHKANKAGTPEEAIGHTISSLWAMMKRSSQFIATGRGFYKLVDS